MDRNDFEPELHSQSMILEDINYKQITNALAYQKDVEYMKSQLSSPIQLIQREVDDVCDQLEYAGSIMFDEYPDKVYLGLLVDNIMDRLLVYEDNENEEGEVQGASIGSEQPVRRYCPDDWMEDCDDPEDDYMVEATEMKQSELSKNSLGFGSGWGPRPWGPPPPPPGPRPWGPPPPPPGPWGRGGCRGILCPLINRPCGKGRRCNPTPFASYDDKGNPNWMRYLVENLLTNEMTFRRSRYRNHNL